MRSEVTAEPGATRAGAVGIYSLFDDRGFTVLVVDRDGGTAASRAARALIHTAGVGADPAVGPIRFIYVPHTPENARELRRVGVRSPAWFLIRPDGHIGRAGRTIDAGQLAEYFEQLLGPEPIDRPGAAIGPDHAR